MGGKRERSGVTAISKNSIQITFTYKGVLCRERIKLQPTPANLKRVALHRSAILHAIATGTFDYAVTFPDSTRRFKFSEEKGAGYALEVYLESWVEKAKAAYQIKYMGRVPENRIQRAYTKNRANLPERFKALRHKKTVR